MIRFGRVEDCFVIKGRAGCVVVFSWLADTRIRAGDQIRLRTPDGQARDTYIAAVEMVCGPSVDRSKAGIMLPLEITKQDVPAGTEIWSLKDELSSRSAVKI